ncbi:MAG: Gfo/Idh/MocA family oxidoreductase [Deltaproteobacteria bacterium]|nr:Gfo/Idh/MocA family oxidoreductase [Deltaproteobacteria bacterium]
MTKQHKLQAAVIGSGKVGQIRCECIESHPDLELIAVCDSNPERVTNAGRKYYQDWHKVIDLRPDLIFVCTTNEYISEIAVAALQAGIHTFCEKPPGRNVGDVQKIIKAEKKNPNLKLKFGFNHRYHQSVMDAKAIVEKQRLGKVLWMRGIYGKAGGPGYDKNWRNNPEHSGGGILIDQGIHMLDLFHLFTGKFDEVKSFIGSMYWKVRVEDNALAIMRNNRGQMAMIHSSATQWKHTFVLDIYLERGYLSLYGILSTTMTYAPEYLKVARCLYDEEGYPLPNPQESINYYDNDRSWILEVEEFVQCILEDRAVRIGNSSDALAAMELVQAIYKQDEKWEQNRHMSAATEEI